MPAESIPERPVDERKPSEQEASFERLPGEGAGPWVPKPLRALFLTVGGFFFALAVLGAALPGLPTTPFLLLTSFFLVRSSPRLHRALLRSRFFGPILRDWQEHRGVRRDVKLQAIVAIVLAVGATWIFGSLAPWLLGAVLALAGVGVLVILRLPTVP